jgi:hypothetical protein
VIWTRADDRVEVDGTPTDLTAAVALARAAGAVTLRTAGDARTGWVSKVFYALLDAGVDVSRGAEVSAHLPRPSAR